MTWNNELLGSMMAELSSLGEFRLSKMSDGKWYANLKFPAPEGVTAECNSGFKHKDPIEAMQCVKDRLGGLRNMMTINTPVKGVTHAEI